MISRDWQGKEEERVRGKMMKDVILLKRLNSNDPWVTEDKENLHDVLLTIVSTGKKNISLVSNGKRVKTFLHLCLLSRLKWPAKIERGITYQCFNANDRSRGITRDDEDRCNSARRYSKLHKCEVFQRIDLQENSRRVFLRSFLGD